MVDVLLRVICNGLLFIDKIVYEVWILFQNSCPKINISICFVKRVKKNLLIAVFQNCAVCYLWMHGTHDLLGMCGYK